MIKKVNSKNGCFVCILIVVSKPHIITEKLKFKKKQNQKNK